MKSLLPLVKPEIGFSLARHMGEITDKKFIKEELDKIDKENPVISDFIYKWSKLDKNKTHTAYCGIIVYNLLKSQAEVNKLEEG